MLHCNMRVRPPAVKDLLQRSMGTRQRERLRRLKGFLTFAGHVFGSSSVRLGSLEDR